MFSKYVLYGCTYMYFYVVVVTSAADRLLDHGLHFDSCFLSTVFFFWGEGGEGLGNPPFLSIPAPRSLFFFFFSRLGNSHVLVRVAGLHGT